jgi:hypothetical protein
LNYGKTYNYKVEDAGEGIALFFVLAVSYLVFNQVLNLVFWIAEKL